eukprot:5956276-Pyramimonas_sp.AAC.1
MATCAELAAPKARNQRHLTSVDLEMRQLIENRRRLRRREDMIAQAKQAQRIVLSKKIKKLIRKSQAER